MPYWTDFKTVKHRRVARNNAGTNYPPECHEKAGRLVCDDVQRDRLHREAVAEWACCFPTRRAVLQEQRRSNGWLLNNSNTLPQTHILLKLCWGGGLPKCSFLPLGRHHCGTRLLSFFIINIHEFIHFLLKRGNMNLDACKNWDDLVIAGDKCNFIFHSNLYHASIPVG